MEINKFNILIYDINENYESAYSSCIFHGWSVKARFIDNRLYGIGFEYKFKR